MTKQASPAVYKDDFKKNVVGQSSKDPSIAYPEHDRLKKIHDQTSKVRFVILAKKAHTLFQVLFSKIIRT